MIQRYMLTIEYNGQGYAGWQRQPNVPSIQQEIEEAIFKFCRQEVLVTVAGRTDAGVHALGQIAHVDFAPFSKPMDEFSIMKAINAHLRPRLISILGVESVPCDFHARFDAVNKLYRYRILNRHAFPTLDSGHVWHVQRPLNVEAMHDAAQCLLGHHDFSSFRGADCQAKTPMRTLDRIDVFALDRDEHGGCEVIVEAEARSFIHHQVRNMVGTLSWVGLGKWSIDNLRDAFDARDRTKAGPSAPADGLYLVHIDYPS